VVVEEDVLLEELELEVQVEVAMAHREQALMDHLVQLILEVEVEVLVT
jgi:phosphoribosylcarboxyaminoimidazole (NCAIR) mutase